MTPTDIDSLDKKIIFRLQEDTRSSFKEMTKEIGVSVSTIRNRTLRLINKGILKMQAKVDPFALPNKIAVVVGGVIKSKGGNVDRADEAEELLIEEMRQLGKEALHDWAVGKEVEKVKEFVNDKDGNKQQGYGFNPALKGGLRVLEGRTHLGKTHTNSFSE